MLKTVICFIFIYLAFCFISLNRHAHSKPFTYHAEIWADKAGYNVYLPLTFIYQDVNFPDSLIPKTGFGFEKDAVSHKIITKYPYGVALLQGPFWLAAHVLSNNKTGYSSYYQKSINFSACFYLTVSLFMLFFTLRHYQSNKNALFLTLAISLSTGVFYYGIFDTGMSHIYSFCCMCGLVMMFFKPIDISNFKKVLAMLLLSVLFVIIRPINSIFLVPSLFCFLYYSNIFNYKHLKTLNGFQFLTLALIGIVFILPQLFYYKYAFGDFFANSYHKEPFFFPSITRVSELLFSSNNGLLIYYPIIICLCLYAFISKNVYTKLLIVLCITYIILYASWWSLSLGCGFGHRAFNDIALLFFIPLCFSSQKISKSIMVILSLCMLINIKFEFSYDGCLYTLNNWDYNEYVLILFGEFK